MMLKKKRRSPFTKYIVLAALVILVIIIYKNPLDHIYNYEKNELHKTSRTHQTEGIRRAQKLEIQGRPQEAIALYQELLYPDKEVALLHINLGATYLRNKNYDAAIRYMNNALEINPTLIYPLIYLGKAYGKKGDYKMASKQYKKVISLKPDNFDAHLNLAVAQMELEQYTQALVHGQRAIKLKPDNVYAYLNTGHVFNKMGKMDQAIEMYRHATKIAPKLANAHHNLGYTLRIKGKLDEALVYLNKAIELKPDYLEAHIARAQTYWGLEDLEHALEEYEWRWGRFGVDPQQMKEVMWDGISDINGKKILLYSEQGLGDTVQFIRYAKLVKERGATVICKVQKPLLTLLSSCPFIDELVTTFEKPHDLRAAIMSLPRIFNTTADTIPAEIPYLSVPDDMVTFWSKKLRTTQNFKVGLCWHVDPKHETLKRPSAMRSASLSSFASLAGIEGVSFYSLQKMNGLDQLKNKPEKLQLHTFGPDFDESRGRFMDTAAVIENLDLVVTVDTSVAHVAAALGKPVWMLLPFSPDCRWYLEKENTPWYPTMRLFRQETQGDFDSVLQYVASELKQKVAQHVTT